MFFAKFFLVAAITVSVNALATPMVARHQHRAVAARIAVPEPAPVPAVFSTPQKRSNGRCRPKPSSSTPSATPSATPSPAAAAPQNVAPDPSSSSSSTSTHSAHTHTTTNSPADTPAPTTSKTAAPAAAQTPSGASGGGGLDNTIHSGDGTFYATGLGACGITNSDTDMIAAIAHDNFDTFPGYNGVNPNNNPICGKQVVASYGGKSVTVTITDRCGGCNTDALDFSPSAFSVLADQSIGRIHNVQWHFIN